ncbi:MAG: thiosulfate reductase, partial [Bdellovibrionota bacterium]
MAQEITSIKITEKHPRLIRWTHWLNVPLLAIMIWSGILIYWANDAYIWIPDSLARSLRINNKLAEGLAWHFNVMWFFTVNGII